MTEQHASDKQPDNDQQALIAAAWKQAEPLWSTVVRAAGGSGGFAEALTAWQNVEIPGYRIVAELQRGGQGVVYRGVQESTQREVAIKVMRDGLFAGPRERARFEREVQILAQLRHPNIVTIHDSGVARHAAYFVMDYIPGHPLDRYVELHAPPLRTRLQLFAKICAAVNVAHLRGVIHRDLKPGNLRVDDAGEPHVLDFGLAKRSAPHGDAAGDVTMTDTGQFVGSLPWASPEQAEARTEDIDLRTDVYSLGVVLYQLLTGDFPYAVSASLGETAHNIVHREARHPRTLNRKLDDDVCTIVLKALRKERDQRYQTAGALGSDIERYLAGAPIEARRDSMTYVLRKHLVRHKLAAGMVLVFLLTLAGGLVTSLSFWRQAVAARNAEAEQHRKAVARAERAAAEAAKAQAVRDFLTEMLETASPDHAQQPDVTVREAVDAAALRLADGALAGQPETRAEIQRVIGTTYAALGQYPEAIEHLQAAHQHNLDRGRADTEEALMCAFRLADAQRSRGDLEAAETLFNETLARARTHHGAGHRSVAVGLNGLADVLRDADRLDEARQTNQEALAILKTLPDAKPDEIATALNDLALVLHQQGRFDDALAMLTEALTLAREAHGPRHRSVAVALNNRASVYGDLGRFDDALADQTEALEIFRATLGARHPDVAACQSAIGVILLKRRDFAAAKSMLADALALRRESLGPDHALVAHSLNNLAMAEYELGNLDAAAEGFAEALAILRKARGPNHPSLASMLNNLAAIQRTRGHHDEAIPLLREVLATHQANQPAGHPQIALAQHNLGRTLINAGQYDEAVELLAAALSARRAAYPDDHSEIASTLEALANARLEQQRLDEAEQYAQEALDMRRRLGGDEHLDVSQSLQMLGLIAQKRGNAEEAAELLGQAVRIAAAHLSPGHWRIGVLQSDHGAALLAGGQVTAAEPVLRAAYDSLSATYGDADSRTQRVIRRLVELYQALHQPRDVETWQKRLVPAPEGPEKAGVPG